VNPKFDISSRDASYLLEGLVSVNRAQHRRHVASGGDPFAVLRLIQTGKLQYNRIDKKEHWKSYEELIANPGDGADCEDLSAAVVAELLNAGIQARTYVYKAKPKLFHVVVQTDRWGFLDPSVTAGMKKV
jgi:hypothetical protein